MKKHSPTFDFLISDWNDISNQIGGRTAKQCRERWQNHLDPLLKFGNWSAEEDTLLIRVFIFFIFIFFSFFS